LRKLQNGFCFNQLHGGRVFFSEGHSHTASEEIYRSLCNQEVNKLFPPFVEITLKYCCDCIDFSHYFEIDSPGSQEHATCPCSEPD
jgi:hypothetical protein